ncbi:MAG: cupin [Spirochaetes bacterium RBG_16_49_21]|nr:MAG: cupin [Spirochaetes bacterium RBG_16_49_21]
MQIKTYSAIKATHFDNNSARSVDARVLIGKDDGANNFCMRIFEISAGGNTPKHAHDWEHEMFIYSGEGEIWGNGRWNKVRSGNAVFVPCNEEHQIKNSGKELLTVVCLVPSKAPEL